MDATSLGVSRVPRRCRGGKLDKFLAFNGHAGGNADTIDVPPDPTSMTSVFTTWESGCVFRNVSTRGLDKAAEASRTSIRLGVAKLTFHDLRHTYGSHLAQSGLDPVGVLRQMH